MSKTSIKKLKQAISKLYAAEKVINAFDLDHFTLEEAIQVLEQQKEELEEEE